ncbi:hypothetical protein EHI8A_216550 [Entamoeba histolytica HM-1:IMSS-B]|uniref:Uncharacterized protein n=6 Tax=Entamoeba histolytica TaxID=5759 RepID=B1N377_ENTH1|nr:hypothetical protein EHI_004830 [Entamoeba histolytica HM-1:IMSS]EMD42874.1 Hypothetical protein EHI5A_099860 [Entamoeba histolytica KU27]EMH76133.1 hypothetical protein EHI8A_216550 [Entamoeba histolytica HM-1:IMSS-B]EMS15802.1 hypothetical protein KM1_284030 [Entamoeba histolytica HM-3:IMSS]ENY64151.1 hypothetical protein EHI7A_186690 [Entamoeba histolytica HM-1:IMSS-A]GAT94552.1 hypothetical protein CL6EHI_004830 [Entamoeba histolytica]|eukprot:XP_001913643.1 hypothetical protein EHI_004830 [Entamoeba histolytica HM-1:IMSS]
MFSFGNLFRKNTSSTPSRPKGNSTSNAPINLNLIKTPEINGVTFFNDYQVHCLSFINDLGNGLESMMDYSPEATNIAIRRAEAMDQSLKRMEFLSNGLEKYLNEMVMIAQTPKPTISTEITPFKRQRTLENMIISQVNESENISNN